MRDHLEFFLPTPPLRLRALRTDRDREDIKYTNTLERRFLFRSQSIAFDVKIVKSYTVELGKENGPILKCCCCIQFISCRTS